MKPSIKAKLAGILGGLWLFTTSANATITFTGGIADLAFYYDSTNDRWDVVFQNKGSTVATGNDTPYGGFTGIVGQSANNVTFSTLQINVTSSQLVNVNGTDYIVTSAAGSSIYTDANQPDLGIRTRLRENQVELGNGANIAANQFDSMRLTLDWANSTTPGGAEFAMFRWDAFGDPADVIYDTANSDFSYDWENWGHTHWHFGFSEVGDYSLVFNIEGIGGTYGATAGTSQVTLNFVVPEPSTALLGMVALGALGFRRRRN